MSTSPCPWCLRPFQPVKRGAHVKRFCRIKCKSEFETAARRYAYKAVELGILSVPEMRRVAALGEEPSRRTVDHG